MDEQSLALELISAGFPIEVGAFGSDLDDLSSLFDGLVPPVALKLSGVEHRTDLGGVQTGIDDISAFETALVRMTDVARIHNCGVRVQRQFTGFEVFVGFRRDAATSALVVVLGRGGVEAELYGSPAIRLGPVGPDDVLRMLKEVPALRPLFGFRNSGEIPTDGLARLVADLSHWMGENNDLESLEFNPIILEPDGTPRIVDWLGFPTLHPRRDLAVPQRVTGLVDASDVLIYGAPRSKPGVLSRLVAYNLAKDSDARVEVIDENFLERYEVIRIRGSCRGGGAPSVDMEDGGSRGTAEAVASIAVAAPQVREALLDAVGRGVRTVVIHSSGFSESGEVGEDLQSEVIQLARQHGVSLLGPNSIGVVTPGQGMCLSFSGVAEGSVRSGPMGLISTSGSVGGCLVSRLQQAGVGLSAWFHVGNQAGVTVESLMEHFLEDESTRIVVLMLEATTDALGFVRVARRLRAAGKAVLALELGSSEEGGEAVKGHTGRLAAAPEVLRLVFRSAGITVLESLAELEIVTILLARCPAVQGERLFVLTASGAAKLIALDVASSLGRYFVQPSEELGRSISGLLPPFAGVSNPLDVTAQVLSNPEMISAVLERIDRSGEYDAALVLLTTSAGASGVNMAKAIVSSAQRSRIPVVAARYGAEYLSPMLDGVFVQAGMPLLAHPDEAVAAMIQFLRAAVSPFPQ